MKHKGWIASAAFSGIAVFGMVMALLGAVLPVLATRLAFGMSAAGTLFLAMNFAMLVAVCISGPVLDRFGMKPPLVLGPLFVAGALLMLRLASNFTDLLPAVAVLGFGGGMLNAGANTLITDLHDDSQRKAAALNLLGVFFGLGALVLPSSIGWLLDSLGLATILAGTAGMCLVASLYAAALSYPPPKAPRSLPLGEIPGMLRMSFVLCMGCLLFLQSGNEFLLGGYLSTYLTVALGSSLREASLLQAALWLSIMVSRIVLSRILLRTDPHRVVAFSAVAAAVGCVWLALAPSLAVAIGAVVLTGWSMAGIFTTALGIAGARFPQRSGTIIGLLLTIALAGGMLLPWLGGIGSAIFGLRLVPWQAAGQFGLIALAAIAVRRMHKSDLAKGIGVRAANNPV